MSDNELDQAQEPWEGSDLVTVNGFGTVWDFVLAVNGGGSDVADDIKADWENKPHHLVYALAREIMRRDAEFEQVVQETASDLAGVGQRLAEAERTVTLLTERFESFDAHYQLALNVVESARQYLSIGPDQPAAVYYDALNLAFHEFDSFGGDVEIDAMAGGQVSVSVVPPIEGEERAEVPEQDAEEVHERPFLTIVPDQD